MRIIAGLAKGRRLVTPASGTRPMTGKARESVFSILAGRWSGATVLDLYAGSGSLGLEAVSRGAKEAVFVESGKDAGECIARNIASLDLGGTLIVGTVEGTIPRLTVKFDVVFVDPPYRADDGAVARVLASLTSVLDRDGVVVMHRQAASTVDLPDFLTCSDERRYGDAVVTIMERSTQ
jgi:16S rRNA (guanine966-N2)-methyltransferase